MLETQLDVLHILVSSLSCPGGLPYSSPRSGLEFFVRNVFHRPEPGEAVRYLLEPLIHGTHSQAWEQFLHSSLWRWRSLQLRCLQPSILPVAEVQMATGFNCRICHIQSAQHLRSSTQNVWDNHLIHNLWTSKLETRTLSRRQKGFFHPTTTTTAL